MVATPQPGLAAPDRRRIAAARAGRARPGAPGRGPPGRAGPLGGGRRRDRLPGGHAAGHRADRVGGRRRCWCCCPATRSWCSPRTPVREVPDRIRRLLGRGVEEPTPPPSRRPARPPPGPPDPAPTQSRPRCAARPGAGRRSRVADVYREGSRGRRRDPDPSRPRSTGAGTVRAPRRPPCRPPRRPSRCPRAPSASSCG